METLEGIKIKQDVGRPKSKLEKAHADSVYNTKKVSSYLMRRIKANIVVNLRNRLKSSV